MRTEEQEREPITSRTGDHRLLSYRVEQLEEAVGEIRDAVRSIDKSLQLLSLVEVQHAKAREQFTEIEKRLRAIEMEIPTLRLVRGWVISGVLGIVGTVGIAGISLALT